MTSHSVSYLNNDDEHRLQALNDHVIVSELDNNILSSNSNNISDSHLDLNLNEHVNLNKKNDENHAITPRSSSTSNLHLVNSSLSSVRRSLSANESEDGFRIVKNKKKHKQIARDDPQALNNGEESRVNPIVPNLDDTELDQNQIHTVNDNQHQLSSYNFVITNESTRFAQTRYPFPPFVLRFGAGKVTKQPHWPKVIGGKSYFFPSAPAIPPQLCLLIKNVDL
ncbi:unnamed protein product, partial [Rotaria sp. Silwood1]